MYLTSSSISRCTCIVDVDHCVVSSYSVVYSVVILDSISTSASLGLENMSILGVNLRNVSL